MRELLISRVPNSLEPSSVPPTPLAAAIRDLIMKPLLVLSQNEMNKDFLK